jgi:hypothetical protein
MSEDDLEEFSVLLARAIQRDYVLFQSVIEEYVAGLTEEEDRPTTTGHQQTRSRTGKDALHT